MKKVLLLTGISLCSYFLSNAQVSHKEAFNGWSKIVGQWQMVENEKEQNGVPALLVEEWSQTDDSTYRGMTFNLSPKNDTTLIERLELGLRGGSTVYVPTIYRKNKAEKTKTFKLTQSSENSWQFENPKNYFPQMISYTLIHPDTLKAHTSGRIGGEPQHQFFNYVRRK